MIEDSDVKRVVFALRGAQEVEGFGGGRAFGIAQAPMIELLAEDEAAAVQSATNQAQQAGLK